MKGVGCEIFDSLVIEVAGRFGCLFSGERRGSRRRRGNGG